MSAGDFSTFWARASRCPPSKRIVRAPAAQIQLAAKPVPRAARPPLRTLKAMRKSSAAYIMPLVSNHETRELTLRFEEVSRLAPKASNAGIIRIGFEGISQPHIVEHPCFNNLIETLPACFLQTGFRSLKALLHAADPLRSRRRPALFSTAAPANYDRNTAGKASSSPVSHLFWILPRSRENSQKKLRLRPLKALHLNCDQIEGEATSPLP